MVFIKENENMKISQAIKTHPDKEARNLLEKAIMFDQRTGVLNREGFKERLNRAIKRANRYNISFTYAFIDLHNLRAYNKISYKIGDKAIETLASLLKKNAREDDAVGRMGESSDEFSLIISGLKEENHSYFLKRMNKIINTQSVVESIPFIVYWGLVEYKGQSIDELHDEADKKMNEEKIKIKTLYSQT